MKPRLGLEVYMFGPLRIVLQGKVVDTQGWKSKKALTLFKLLAQQAGVRIPKDVLIEALWQDGGDLERGSHNLHTVVHYLRRALEPDLRPYEPPRLIRQGASLYWLEAGPNVTVDVGRFQDLIRRAQTLHGPHPSEALRSYKQAVALYTDDFLPENVYDDWATAPRESLQEKYFAAVAAVAQLTGQLHVHQSQAIQLCRRALRRDGSREELHRALIHLLAQQGLYGEAADQYHQCERTLRDEYRVRPGPETRLAYERILVQEAVEQGAAPTARIVSGGRGGRF